MIDEEKIELTADKVAKQKSLELLFDYTKFHIGLYLTLTSSYLVVATAKVDNKLVFTLCPDFLWPAVLAFMLAGLAGGVIANIIYVAGGSGATNPLATVEAYTP